MLVVRERRTLVVASPPSLHRVPDVGPAGEGLKDVERHKEDVRVEVPTHSHGQASAMSERLSY